MYCSEKYDSKFDILLVWCTSCEKYMPCMFCRKILMSSSSAIYGWFLLFLIERKIWIKLGYDNFCTVLIYYVEHRKNTKSIVWYFS
jgi:uncharacterized CHY-type Zn-finger protein